jgi:large conductance mechanosensitive channel
MTESSEKNIASVPKKTSGSGKTTEKKPAVLKAAGKVKAHGKIVGGVMAEFKDFLKEYKILGIAAGLVIGSAVTTLTGTIVAGLITPALQLLIPSESIKSLVFPVGAVTFQVGAVVSALINFIVVALLFFLFVKFFMKQEKVTKDSIGK